MAKAISKEQEHLSHEIQKLMKASEKLAIANEILAHENQRPTQHVGFREKTS